ncbi:hypothetical protein GGF32_006235 [Allomyces javanicus]|nr:hypothetical protein GGF32_006235 [Allomyces javanicus]
MSCSHRERNVTLAVPSAKRKPFGGINPERYRGNFEQHMQQRHQEIARVVKRVCMPAKTKGMKTQLSFEIAQEMASALLPDLHDGVDGYGFDQVI